MIIAFTAVNTRAEIQKFMCQLDSLEASLDVVSLIVSNGNRLLDAVFIEGGTPTPLPLEAFDGQPLSGPIKQLENQWKHLLSEPVNSQPSLYDLLSRRINRHHSNITKFEHAVTQAEQRLQRVAEELSDGPHHTLIIRQIATTLKRYQSNLEVEVASLQRCRERCAG